MAHRGGHNRRCTTGAAAALLLLSLLLAIAVQHASAFRPLPLSRRQPQPQQQQQARPSTTTAVAAAKQRGGKGYGQSSSSKSTGSASGGPVGVDGRSLRGFTKVLAEGQELGAAKDSQKAVGPFKVGGEEKFLLLVRRQNGAVSALDANCGRCKFPLLNGKVLEDQSIDSEGDDKEVIACPLCAVTHSLADGRVTGAQASGLLQKVSASFFQKQVATGVKAYPAVGGDDGGVYVQLR